MQRIGSSSRGDCKGGAVGRHAQAASGVGRPVGQPKALGQDHAVGARPAGLPRRPEGHVEHARVGRQPAQVRLVVQAARPATGLSASPCQLLSLQQITKHLLVLSFADMRCKE